MVVGAYVAIFSIPGAFYDTDLYLSHYTFGSDYYTETYNAAYKTFQSIEALGTTIARWINDLRWLFGIFCFCFFGIKLTEILELKKTKTTAKPNKTENLELKKTETTAKPNKTKKKVTKTESNNDNTNDA
jgi:hypothetical protein